MDSPAAVYLLRAIHVVFGVVWVGALVFIAAFLTPSVRAAGPGGGAVMQQIVLVRRLPLWLMMAMLLTLVSGLTLYWCDSAGFRSAWLASGPGRTFGLGGALAIVAAIFGMAVNVPTARRLGALVASMQSGGPPPPENLAEIQRLQAKLAWAGTTAAVLVLLATLAMAVARYVP